MSFNAGEGSLVINKLLSWNRFQLLSKNDINIPKCTEMGKNLHNTLSVESGL